MHFSCLVFAAAHLKPQEVKGKTVIDVGSYNHNGNLHDLYQHYEPSTFVGADLFAGPGVDVVCPAEDIAKKFGEESFDIVLSSELLEHARNWREVVSNIKRVAKRSGTILITTRSKGFGLHGYPHDYWRYELDDMRAIFSDMEIVALESDRQAPGVFIKMRKPMDFKENDTKDIALYSIIEDKRTKHIDERAEKVFHKKSAKRERYLKLFKAVELKILNIGHWLIFR